MTARTLKEIAADNAAEGLPVGWVRKLSSDEYWQAFNAEGNLIASFGDGNGTGEASARRCVMITAGMNADGYLIPVYAP